MSVVSFKMEPFTTDNDRKPSKTWRRMIEEEMEEMIKMQTEKKMIKMVISAVYKKVIDLFS